MPTTPRKLRLLLGALAIALGSARPAGADLGSDADRVELAYSAFGRVHRPKPRLLERGEVLPLLLPKEIVDSADGCLTLAVLGTTNVQFFVDPGAGRARRGILDLPESSLAGAVELTRCGAQRARLSTVIVEMRSPRAVLEVVAVSSAKPPPALALVLPHRDPGPMAPPGGSGPRPAVAPLSLRIQAAEQRAVRAGAIEVKREELKSTGLGSGVELVPLGAGCHVFELFAGERTRADWGSVDLDLEVASVDGSRVLATDKSESDDARALVCVGEPAPVAVRFAGAPPASKVTLFHARWDLASGLPERWPPEARAGFSAVLREQGLTLAAARLVDEALGVQGATSMPVAVESGACYLMLVIELRGVATALAAGARAGRNEAQSRAPSNARGVGLSFCAGASTRALLEVEARGTSLVWMSALFQVGRTELAEALR